MQTSFAGVILSLSGSCSYGRGLYSSSIGCHDHGTVPLAQYEGAPELRKCRHIPRYEGMPLPGSFLAMGGPPMLSRVYLVYIENWPHRSWYFFNNSRNTEYFLKKTFELQHIKLCVNSWPNNLNGLGWVGVISVDGNTQGFEPLEIVYLNPSLIPLGCLLTVVW